jgi:hypothetical protein
MHCTAYDMAIQLEGDVEMRTEKCRTASILAKGPALSTITNGECRHGYGTSFIAREYNDLTFSFLPAE